MRNTNPTLNRRIIVALAISTAVPTLAGEADKPLTTVEQIDIERYMGSWYEIARYPNFFQRGIVAVKVSYRLKDDGNIVVRNTGRRGTLDGKLTKREALAWIPDEEMNARWYVRFIWPLRADYWIIDLAKDYRYAVVGQPSRDNLWVISRTPTMTDEDYRVICKNLRQQGYDPDKLKKTLQPPSRTVSESDGAQEKNASSDGDKD